MSNPDPISLWRKKSEVDYIPLFFSLWLSLNAWLRDKYEVAKDRDLIDLLKRTENPIKDRFSRLMNSEEGDGKTFQGLFSELIKALNDATISYPKQIQERLKIKGDAAVGITFSASIVDWNDGSYELVNLMKKEDQKNRIRLDDNISLTDDVNQIFAAYIENLYQIRCLLFHGSLAPTEEIERVIRDLYLTLSMVMDRV